MTDIVGRLRNTDPEYCELLLGEAADEIERLRALIRKYINHVRDTEGVSFLADGYKHRFSEDEWSTLKELEEQGTDRTPHKKATDAK